MKYFQINIQILIICLLICGCNKLVEVDLPIDKIAGDAAFSTNENANATMIGAYFIQVDDIFWFNINLELSADNIDDLGGVSIDHYTNNLSASVPGMYWEKLYNMIFRTNSIIEGLTQSTSVTASLKQTLIAEARFIRAWQYFYLVNLYGNLPLVTSSDYKVNATLERTTASKIYDFIVDELIACQASLPENYIGGNGITPAQERIRPNKYAATAMLAKAYLYRKEYAKAEAECNKIIQMSGTYKLEPIDKVFLAQSSEAIWQMQPLANNLNTQDARKYILLSKPGGETPYALPEYFLNQFDADDKRLASWIGRFTDESATPHITYAYPYKYKATNKEIGAAFSEYYIMIRLAEIYLIRAEARARQEKISEANNDINEIRLRAGIDEIDLTSSEDLVTEIIHQRSLELFTEQGNRWLDLKRTGLIDEVMNVATQRKGGTWISTKQLFPVPALEIIKNPNLKPQNPGY